jgi:D-lactate dehydrogenase
MKILIYSSKEFEYPYILNANNKTNGLTFTEKALSIDTAGLAKGYDAVSIFAGDDASAPVIEKLQANKIKYIAIRAAGYDNVDVKAATRAGIKCANVPDYSPYSVAEHAVALILALNRKIILADRQVHGYDFTVDKLIGFDLHNKTVGIIGTGKIGCVASHILHGFGCNILAYDVIENRELMEICDVKYTYLKTVFAKSDIITIHVPLTEDTRHLVNKELLALMKPGALLINTARGAVIDTEAAVEALEKGKIGGLGLDVYENEKGLFFYDHSGEGLKDGLLQRLLDNHNVIITPHQAFATKEALTNIADTTFYNINCWAENKSSENELN